MDQARSFRKTAGSTVLLACALGLGQPAAADITFDQLVSHCTAADGADLFELAAVFEADGWDVLTEDTPAQDFEPFYVGVTLISWAGAGATDRDPSIDPARLERAGFLMQTEAETVRRSHEELGELWDFAKLYLRHPEGALLILSNEPPDFACTLFGSGLDFGPFVPEKIPFDGGFAGLNGRIEMAFTDRGQSPAVQLGRVAAEAKDAFTAQGFGIQEFIVVRVPQ